MAIGIQWCVMLVNLGTTRNIYKRERKENLEEKKTQGLQSQLATPFPKRILSTIIVVVATCNHFPPAT